jgi:toxin ParE1/3/4
LRFLDAVKRECLLLAEYPGVGTLRRRVPKRLRGLRSWPIRGFRKFLIFYMPVEGGVDVIRVLHGARRLGRALREPAR